MKQTAVEWLSEQIFNDVDLKDSILKLAIQQAKEMEKEQMRNSSCPYIGGWEDDEFEYWYNETFKKTEQ